MAHTSRMISTHTKQVTEGKMTATWAEKTSSAKIQSPQKGIDFLRVYHWLLLVLALVFFFKLMHVYKKVLTLDSNLSSQPRTISEPFAKKSLMLKKSAPEKGNRSLETP